MTTLVDIEGSVALVTGASRGIGRAIARRLAAEGCDVALVARSGGDLREVAQEIEEEDGRQALVIEQDLRDDDAHQRIVRACIERFGQLDVVVHNAGVGARGDAAEADLDDWDRAIEINLRAVMRLTREALPHLEAAGSGRGAMIYIASISGKMSSGGSAAYCATKHGVVGFAGSVFEDAREAGVKVCAICPGFVNTEMVGGRGLDEDKMIQPEDIAELVATVARFPETACPTEIIVRPQRTPRKGG